MAWASGSIGRFGPPGARPRNSDWVSGSREEGSWDISVDAMSAPSELGPVGAAGSVIPPGLSMRSTSSVYSPLTLRLSVTCDLVDSRADRKIIAGGVPEGRVRVAESGLGSQPSQQ